METLINKNLFGKEVSFRIYNTDENIAKDLVEEAYTEALRLQKIFNFYDEKSTLSLLNKKRSLQVPKELLEVLKKSIKMSKETEDYNITLGKQFMNRKSGAPLENLNCSYKDLEIKGDTVTLKNPDVLIDLGSIAKGYIVDKLVENLEQQGLLSGLVDGRGDLRIFGDKEQIIGIQHPRNDTIIKSIKLKNASVATSGDYNQYAKNFDNCHILNKKDLISVTVVANDLTTADLFATAVFVSKEAEIKRLLKDKDLKVMTIDKNLNIKYYNKFETLLCN